MGDRSSEIGDRSSEIGDRMGDWGISNPKSSHLRTPISELPSPSYSCQSGITHCGGADIFLRRASSAISCILSKEVSLINLEADST
jgi:hypothetical protein